MTRRFAFCLIGFVIAAGLAANAAAQNPPPTRIRGEIVQIEGSTLTIKPRAGGAPMIVKLADNVAVNGLTKTTLGDVAVGKYVGIASIPQPDGTLRALEVLVFPDAMRGVSEGHFAWDLQPQSMMTNANVADIGAGAPTGRTLTLRYKDGEKQILVPEGVPIVVIVPMDRTALVPGAHVFIAATQLQPDGTYTAARLNVGLNGLVPPM